MRKVLLTTVIAIIILVVIVIGTNYYMIGRTKNLNVNWTEQDYNSYLQKVGAIDSMGNPTDLALNAENSDKPGPKVNATFTNEEISAMISKECASSKSPIKDVSVKFLPNNELEITFLTSDEMIPYLAEKEIQKYNIPGSIAEDMQIYAKMKVTQTSAKTIDLDVSSIQLGKINLPQNTFDSIVPLVESSINSRLESLDNFSIDNFSSNENTVSFNGTLQSPIKIIR